MCNIPLTLFDDIMYEEMVRSIFVFFLAVFVGGNPIYV